MSSVNPDLPSNVVSIQEKLKKKERDKDAELYRLILARVDHLNLDSENIRTGEGSPDTMGIDERREDSTS